MAWYHRWLDRLWRRPSAPPASRNPFDEANRTSRSLDDMIPSYIIQPLKVVKDSIHPAPKHHDTTHDTSGPQHHGGTTHDSGHTTTGHSGHDAGGHGGGDAGGHSDSGGSSAGHF